MTVHGQFALARVDKSRVTLRALLIGVVVSLVASIVLSTASAVDGPVMRYRSSSADGDVGDALIPGLLELEGNCLYVVQSNGERYPILWPAGTRWDDDALAVLLSRGDALAVGSEIVGGGGYLYVDDVQRLAGSEAAERAQECVDNTFSEIAVVDNHPEAIGKP